MVVIDGSCVHLPLAQVMFEGILLKPSMVTPGAECEKREKPEVVADYTLKLLKRRVPPAVPGASPDQALLFLAESHASASQHQLGKHCILYCA